MDFFTSKNIFKNLGKIFFEQKMEFWNFVQQSCAKCHYIFFCQIKVLLGLLQIETFFLLNSNSIIAYISNCNILVHTEKKKNGNWVSKITCPKIGKMRRGFVTTQLFMELLKNNGPLWRNQTISLCMDYLKNARIFMGKHGDIRLILMLLRA